MARREQEHVELPIPNGWFAVEFSRELREGDVKPIHYCGEDLVLFRTRSGHARVLDAFCPHLGAHLGHGFAGGIALEAAEIDRERGVVIEEWRGRQGAGSRMQAPQMEALYGESRYVNRLPIGLPEQLKGVAAQRVRDFYRDFYRADRMALIAVGDLRGSVMSSVSSNGSSSLS
jgi:nitrite reductase/ring-hydroxylating ferredoxin subunit